jgi:hypothetical protein
MVSCCADFDCYFAGVCFFFPPQLWRNVLSDKYQEKVVKPWCPVDRTHPKPSGPDDQEAGRRPPAASGSFDQFAVGLVRDVDLVIDNSSLHVDLEPDAVMVTATQPVLVPCDDANAFDVGFV